MENIDSAPALNYFLNPSLARVLDGAMPIQCKSVHYEGDLSSFK